MRSPLELVLHSGISCNFLDCKEEAFKVSSIVCFVDLLFREQLCEWSEDIQCSVKGLQGFPSIEILRMAVLNITLLDYKLKGIFIVALIDLALLE